MGEIRASVGKALQIQTLGFRSASSQILGFCGRSRIPGLLGSRQADRNLEAETAALRQDAIHLATAASISRQLGALITYDQRMISEAQTLGLPVLSPA
jgi:hypothetical protein